MANIKDPSTLLTDWISCVQSSSDDIASNHCQDIYDNFMESIKGCEILKYIEDVLLVMKNRRKEIKECIRVTMDVTTNEAEEIVHTLVSSLKDSVKTIKGNIIRESLANQEEKTA